MVNIASAHVRSSRGLVPSSCLDTGPTSPPIVAASGRMQALVRNIQAMARSDAPVLIHGASGTGKELVARAIHSHSRRSGHVLVALNCGAFPDSLVDAELFGHERGAFTGAVGRRPGRFRAAHLGTLFLDEVAELSLPTQAKLLRVLQEGAFEPLGSDVTVRVDVRVVSATHKNLENEVKSGRFREDLYYRLKALRLEVPPLRERSEDIPALVEQFLRTLARGTPPRVGDDALQALLSYPYPGNVRELKHAVEHALVFAEFNEIRLRHLPEEIAGGPTPGLAAPPALDQAIREFERQYLIRALTYCGGNRTRTAELLGIARKTLWEKMRAHHISAEEFETCSAVTQ
jgi:DNA-binding NtrC family response regulator